MDMVLMDGKQPIPQDTWGNVGELNLSKFGQSLGDGVTPSAVYPLFPTVDHHLVQNFRGAGIYPRGHDSRTFFCTSLHNHIGARIESSDSEIAFCRLQNHRDACLWLNAGGSNVQSSQNHMYGSRMACYNEGMQIFRSSNDTFADALIGYMGDRKGPGSGQTTFTNALFQHNQVRDVLFQSDGCHLNKCIVNVQSEVTVNSLSIPGVVNLTGKVGVELANFCSIDGGSVEMLNWHNDQHIPTGKPIKAIQVSGNSCDIQTSLVGVSGLNGSVGIYLNGFRKGLKVDCRVYGFDKPKDKLLVAPQGGTIDVTFRIEGLAPGKAARDYLTLANGWKGHARIIDTSSWIETNFVEGIAV